MPASCIHRLGKQQVQQDRFAKDGTYAVNIDLWQNGRIGLIGQITTKHDNFIRKSLRIVQIPTIDRTFAALYNISAGQLCSRSIVSSQKTMPSSNENPCQLIKKNFANL